MVEPVSESHREAARSLGTAAPADAAGGYQALAKVMTGSLRRPRRDVSEGVKMTTFGK
jgi:serine/threonine protein kinase HipA of HipAB toxin-antitoxin module